MLILLKVVAKQDKDSKPASNCNRDPYLRLKVLGEVVLDAPLPREMDKK